MNVAIIPARGGSKRIPKKNIKLFNGKPIIAYSIEAAIQSNLFSHIVVSTDDVEIAAVAKEYGASVPFMRPELLSDDFTGTMPVVKHAIEELEAIIVNVKNVCCMYATAPLLQAVYLEKGLKVLEENKHDYVFSVTSFAYPIQRAFSIHQSQIQLIYPHSFHNRSQDLIEAYHDAGQFYWGTKQAFLNERALFSDRSYPLILPRYLVQDIDTLEDWKRAELMQKIIFSYGACL